MICNTCGFEYDGDACHFCNTKQFPTASEETKPELPIHDACEINTNDAEPDCEQVTEHCECEPCCANEECAGEQNKNEPEAIPQKKICPKCGYEYEEDDCPVCVAVAKRRLNAAKKKSPLGLIGMIMAISGIVLDFTMSLSLATLPIGIASLIFSIIGKKKNKKDGFATAGIWVSVFKILLNVAVTVIRIITVVLVILFYAFVIILAINAGHYPFSDVDSVF